MFHRIPWSGVSPCDAFRPVVESSEAWIGNLPGAVAVISFCFYSLGEIGAIRVNDWEVTKMKIRPRAATREPNGVGCWAGHFSKSARNGAPPVIFSVDAQRQSTDILPVRFANPPE
jgi:hypothetical protein